MSGATARIPQRETKHIKQLDTVLKYRLGIVPDEKITVYTGDPKPMALVKGKLIAKGAGTHLNLPRARFAKKIDNPPQERGAIATFLVGWWYSNAHKLVRAFPEWLDYADANDGLT